MGRVPFAWEDEDVKCPVCKAPMDKVVYFAADELGRQTSVQYSGYYFERKKTTTTRITTGNHVRHHGRICAGCGFRKDMRKQMWGRILAVAGAASIVLMVVSTVLYYHLAGVRKEANRLIARSVDRIRPGGWERFFMDIAPVFLIAAVPLLIIGIVLIKSYKPYLRMCSGKLGRNIRWDYPLIREVLLSKLRKDPPAVYAEKFRMMANDKAARSWWTGNLSGFFVDTIRHISRKKWPAWAREKVIGGFRVEGEAPDGGADKAHSDIFPA